MQKKEFRKRGDQVIEYIAGVDESKGAGISSNVCD